MTAPARSVAAIGRLPARLAGPELVPVALALAAWVALVGWGDRIGHAAPAVSGVPAGSSGSAEAAGHIDHGRDALGWTVMVVAMMLPLAVPFVRTAAERSLRRRRAVAVAEVILAFLTVWLWFGALVHLLVDLGGLAGWGAAAFRAAAVGLLLAGALWRRTEHYRRARLACHRTRPLAPFSPAADRDCLRFGLDAGLRCAATCALPMAAMAMLPHSIGLAAALTLVALAERARRLSPEGGSVALAVVAVVVAAGA